jgi:hypothetical protein
MRHIKDSPFGSTHSGCWIAGRRESVAESRCRYGFGETWQFALAKGSGVAPRECAPPPSESTPKGSSQLPLVWATLSELDHFVAALALQQDGQQSALC